MREIQFNHKIRVDVDDLKSGTVDPSIVAPLSALIEAWGVSPTTAQKWVKAGHFNHVKVGYKAFRLQEAYNIGVEILSESLKQRISKLKKQQEDIL